MGMTRRLAGLGAAAAMSAALMISVPTAAHAASYCSGNVVEQHDGNGFSSRLIESYDGNSICVNTWNQTGHQAWTWAVIKYPNGSDVAHDWGNYTQYASTGWVPKSGCWQWVGIPVSPGSGTWNVYYHCF